MLGKVIYNITGLKMDHFVKVGLLGFLRISNALGGVDLCLNAAQNPQTDSDENSEGYSGINLKAGWNYGVKGTQAVAFVRQRHGLPRGDIDRIVRQQYFLSAAFRKVSAAGTLLNPVKLNDLVKAVSSSLVIDSNLDIFQFANQMRHLSAGNLTFATIPNNPNAWAGDISIVELKTAEIPDFINDVLGRNTSTTSVAPADPSKVTVNVLNNTSSNGMAEPAVAVLKSIGFTASVQAGPDVSATTTVQYPSGMEAAAAAVAKYVPGAALVKSSSVQKVTLVLGDDGITVVKPGLRRAARQARRRPSQHRLPPTRTCVARPRRTASTERRARLCPRLRRCNFSEAGSRHPRGRRCFSALPSCTPAAAG